MLIKGMKIKLSTSNANLDLEKRAYLYKAIEDLRNTAKKLPLSKKAERDVLRKEIKALREEYKNCNSILYIAEFSKGNKKAIEEYNAPIKAEDLKHSVEYYISKCRSQRAEYKRNVEQRKTMLGYTYSTVGGVFLSDKSILAIETGTNPQTRIRETKAPHKDIKSNYVGVELEFNCKVDRATLERKFIEAKLAGYVQLKSDGSIRRDNDGDHSHELAILCKQEYQKDVMQRVCAVLNSSSVEGYVNNSCGLHVHLDSRNRDVRTLYHNLVKALPMLKGMVPKVRTEGSHAQSYCAMNTTSNFDDGGHASNNSRRYQAINPEAFARYKTIEVRLHSGSLNAAKIINWITILTMLADRPDKIPHSIANAEDFGREFPTASSKLLEYIRRRTMLFETLSPAKADTRGDHYWIEETEIVA